MDFQIRNLTLHLIKSMRIQTQVRLIPRNIISYSCSMIHLKLNDRIDLIM